MSLVKYLTICTVPLHSIILCSLNIHKHAFFHSFHSCVLHIYRLSQITLIFLAIIVWQICLPSLTRYSSFSFLLFVIDTTIFYKNTILYIHGSVEKVENQYVNPFNTTEFCIPCILCRDMHAPRI